MSGDDWFPTELARALAASKGRERELQERAERAEAALRALVSEIEDTVDCSCEDGESWRCTVQYDDAMLARAKRALHGFSERRVR